jgi:hypothetical protein
MPGTSDFRRQAETCLSLSLIDPDNIVSSLLVGLAQNDANGAVPRSPTPPTMVSEALPTAKPARTKFG